MPEKILVVDDDVDSLKLIGLMLQRHGYEVVAAHTGTQALTKAETEQPNLIILDVMMPDMSGYDVCKRLRATPSTQSIPIIMFTAKTLIDDKVAGFEAGADDYLTKPTHPAELASRVKSVLARNASRQGPSPSDKGIAIGVLGAKGGVGTTTLALNLASALQQMGENPILADFRLGNGGLGLMLGMARSQGMARVLSRPPQEITPSLIETELIVHHSGLRALVSSVRAKEALINYSFDSVLATIKVLRQIGKPAIFDLGGGFNVFTQRLQMEMDRLLFIVEPNMVALTQGREILNEIGVATERVYIVVANRSQSSLQTSWNDIEQILGQDIRVILSAAPELAFQAIEAGVPMVQVQPNAIVSNQIMKFAEEIRISYNTKTTIKRKSTT